MSQLSLLLKPRKIPFLLLTTELVYHIFAHFSLGKTYELPIKDGAINATDLGKIKDEHGEVTRSFDPAYMNTVTCVRKSLFLICLYRFLRFLSLMEIKESLNIEVIPLSN